MRRLRTAHEPICGEVHHNIADNMRLVFRADESVATNLYSRPFTGGTTAFISTATSMPARAVYGPMFGSAASVGSRLAGSDDYKWFYGIPVAALDGDTSSLQYSFGGWFNFDNGSGTVPLVSYSGEPPSPMTPARCERFGLYVNTNGALRYCYDSTASTRWDYTVATLVGGQPYHIDVVTTGSLGGYRAVDIYLNAQRVFSTTSIEEAPSAAHYTQCSLNIGASFRLGVSAMTPYVGDGIFRFSDVYVRNDAVDPAWIRQVYADGLRPWDEYAMLKGGNYRVEYRVLVEDQDGGWVDLSNHFGKNWVKECSTNEDVDSDNKRFTVKLHRWFGQNLDLALMNTNSRLNKDAADASEELLEARRKIRLETAMVPSSWVMNGWEWEIEADGFIDTLEWGGDEVQLDCVDRMAPLQDVFQIDPREYAYYDVVKNAEDHLQDLLDNNSPVVVTSAGTASYGYKGGAIKLYTPNSTGWAIRHDESPADFVLNNLNRIADQNAWDIRWKHYEAEGKPRLTYFDPNRVRQISVATVRNGGGYHFQCTSPHGMRVGQAYSYNDSVGDAEHSGYVDAVLDSHNFISTQTYTALASPTSSLITYGPCYSFDSKEVLDISRVNKTIQDVRNYIVCKFNRSPTTNSARFGPFHTYAMGGGGYGGAVCIGLGQGLSFINGDEFTVSNLSPAIGGNTGYTFTVASVGLGRSDEAAVILRNGGIDQIKLYSAEPIPGVVAHATSQYCSFHSDIIKFQQQVSFSTTNINKYGLRPAQISEGSTTNIHSMQDAYKLTQRVLSDLQEPNISVEMKVKYFRHLELHDWLAIDADPFGRWTSRFTGAVTSIRHTLTPNGCTTELGLRYSAPTRGARAARRITVGPTRPGLPIRNFAPVALPGAATQQPQASVAGNKSIRVYVPPADGAGDERYRRVDHLEVHVSTATSGFIPNQNTLAGKFTGGYAEVTKLADGSDFSPGSTFYTKMRWVDIYGNPSTWTSASPMRIQTLAGGEGAVAAIGVSTAATLTLISAPGATLIPFDTDNGNDSLSITRDPLSRFTTSATSASASFFTMQTRGRYSVDVSLNVCPSRTQATQVQLLVYNYEQYAAMGGVLATPYYILSPKIDMPAASSATRLWLRGTIDSYTFGERIVVVGTAFSSGFYLHEYNCTTIHVNTYPGILHSYIKISLEDPNAPPTNPYNAGGAPGLPV